MQLKFRRNISRGGGFGKRSLLILIAIAIVGGLFLLFSKMIQPLPAPVAQHYVLSVRFLENNRYLVGTDTSNYDQFASTLLRLTQKIPAQAAAKIVIYIPDWLKASEMEDIYQVALATGYPTELRKE